MGNIKVDFKYAKVFEKNIMQYALQVSEIHKKLHLKANSQTEFCGWLDLPTNYDKSEFEKIKKSAKKFNQIQMFCWL